MALSYPPYFPAAFLDPVVAAESTAERQFHKARADAAGDRQQLRKAAAEYVTALVLAFARQACAAARASELSLSDVGWFVDDFERRASVHAFYGLQLRGLWSQWEFFRDDVIPQIHQSSGWLEHLEDRERCAASSKPAGTDVSAAPEAASDTSEESSNSSDKQSRAKTRRAFVDPRLMALNMSSLDWGKGADPAVDYNTVRGYLDGKTLRLRTNTRSKLATALKVSPDELPE